jgi:hypothetical protein
MWGKNNPMQIVFIRLKSLRAQDHDVRSCVLACPKGDTGARYVAIYFAISDVLRIV